jgi:hypothetical protein
MTSLFRPNGFKKALTKTTMRAKTMKTTMTTDFAAMAPDARGGGSDAKAGRLLALAPLRAEALALRWGAPELHVERCGMGAQRAQAAAHRLAPSSASAFVVAGVGGALDRRLATGDIVVASELRNEFGERRPLRPDSDSLADLLRTLGHPVHVAPIVSSEQLVTGSSRRQRLAEDGAHVVDTESWWLAACAGARPFAVVRVVVDAPDRELLRLGTAWRGLEALRVLARIAPALARWGGQIDSTASAASAEPRHPRAQPALQLVS